MGELPRRLSADQLASPAVEAALATRAQVTEAGFQTRPVLSHMQLKV